MTEYAAKDTAKDKNEWRIILSTALAGYAGFAR